MSSFEVPSETLLNVITNLINDESVTCFVLNVLGMDSLLIINVEKYLQQSLLNSALCCYRCICKIPEVFSI